MYGYSFGAAKAGVSHRIDHAAMLYPGHTAHDKPLLLHYGRLFRAGASFAFRKHWFHGFDPLLCPPWPHLRPRGGEAPPAGGLFPFPPTPDQLRGKVGRGREETALAAPSASLLLTPQN